MKTRERKLDIFHEEITVRFLAEQAFVDSAPVFGMWTGSTRTIELSPGPADRVRRTLLHELFHAFISCYCGCGTLDKNDEAEELMVRACELGIVHILKHKKNAWVANFLFHKGDLP